MTTIYTKDGVALKVDGKIAAHENCCCNIGIDCDECTGTTPKFYEVTFLGIKDCEATPVDCTEFNTTFVLEQSGLGPAPCSWRYAEGVQAGDKTVRLEFEFGNFRLFAQEVRGGLIIDTCFSDFGVSMDADCNEGTATNSLAIGDCNAAAFREGYDGSATITKQ